MPTNTKSPITHSIYRSRLKKQIHLSQKQVRKNIALTQAKITHRTQARNRRTPHKTFAEEQLHRRSQLRIQLK